MGWHGTFLVVPVERAGKKSATLIPSHGDVVNSFARYRCDRSGSPKSEFYYIAYFRVMTDPTIHDPVDRIHTDIDECIRPIGVVFAGGERGAAAPVVLVREHGAQATYPPGGLPALGRPVEAVSGWGPRCSLFNLERLQRGERSDSVTTGVLSVD